MRNAYRFGMGRLGGLWAALVIVLACSSNAWAVLLAYEGFNYTPGTLLVSGGTGIDGGTGWGGPWDEAQGSSLDTAVQATSLTYTDLLGNSLVTSGGKLLNLGSASAASQPGRNLAARRSSPETGATVSTWVSFLGQRIGEKDFEGTFNGTYRNGANLALFDFGTGATQAEKLNLGESSNIQFPGQSGNEDRWMSRFVGIPTGFIVPQPYDPNPTGATTAGQVRDAYSSVKFENLALFVMRIDHVAGDLNGSTATTNPGQNGGNDNVLIWMNPNLNSTPLDANASMKYVSTDIVNTANNLATPIQPYSGAPGTPAAGNGGEIDFNRIRLFARNPNGTSPLAQWLFDELRVGETFADVTPFTTAGVPGDYNQNNVVDAGDYIVWRDAVVASATSIPNRSGSLSGTVGTADFDFWKTRFGATSGSGSVSGSAVVPEPATWLLCALACCASSCRLVRRRRAG